MRLLALLSINVYLLLILVIFTRKINAQPCDSPCSKKAFPHCGSWLREDNALEASGVYLVGEGRVNLSCTVDSLPKPAEILWWFRADHAHQWNPVHCSSLRIVKECSFNSIGEHKVTSNCKLKVTELQQSGVYKCTAGQPEEGVTSKTAHVHVYGISNITAHVTHLRFGGIGELSVELCANPKPDILWISGASNVAVFPGHSFGDYSALHLQPVVKFTDDKSPADKRSFCHVAKLIISRVRKNHTDFTVIASNAVATRKQRMRLTVLGVPISRAHSIRLSVIVAALCALAMYRAS